MKQKNLVALIEAIDIAKISDLELLPETYNCPTAYDGSMFSYTLYSEGEKTVEFDSCTYATEFSVPGELLWNEIDNAREEQNKNEGFWSFFGK